MGRLTRPRRTAAATAAVLIAAAGVAGAATDWSYEGATGPSHWATIFDGKYKLCGDGKRQSPINLRNPDHAAAAAISTTFVASVLTQHNNGHTVEVSPARAETLHVGAKAYKLLQFHFHSRSEHAGTGARAPLEIHFVHQAADKSYAVLGVFVRRGARNAAFGRLLETMPASDGGTLPVNGTLNPARLLPASRRAYRYAGSLTTPPCSEGLSWMVLAKPITISKAQLDAVRKIVHGNVRPLQPRNGRALTLR